MNTLPDWNRSSVQRLILDAEAALTHLDHAMHFPDSAEQARALRNGRRAWKDIARRRRNFLLTPHSAVALEHLLDQIRERLRLLREKLVSQ